MAFMMTSSNDCKSDICQFFIKTYSIFLIQYMYKISCKSDKTFQRYSMFFHHGPTSHPLPWDFQGDAEMFLGLTSLNRMDVKVHKTIRFIFIGKITFICLLIGVWIISHFPLEFPIIYFVKSMIEITRRKIFIRTIRKKWVIIW